MLQGFVVSIALLPLLLTQVAQPVWSQSIPQSLLTQPATNANLPEPGKSLRR